MNIKLFLFTALLFHPFLLAAQGNYSVSGKVSDSKGIAIPNAILIVESVKDSSFMQSEVANSEGVFTITLRDFTDLQMRAQSPGFISQTKVIGTVKENVTIDFILKQNNTLSEVTISARKPIYEQKADRTIFNVENSITASGGDAWDALKKTPGILIMNNQVTIAGKGSVGVMINGRMQQLSGDDLTQLLHSIPSDNLSKIEVITTPPAKYDAEGNSGIINLVTKKNLSSGLKGSVTVGCYRNSAYGPSLSTVLNYRKEKLNVFCNVNIGNRVWKYTNRTNTYYPEQHWKQTLDQSSANKNAKILVGADYTIGKQSILGFSFSDAFNKIDNIDSVNSTSLNLAQNTDSVIKTKGNTHDLFRGKYTVNLNYEWKDTLGRKLNIDMDYYSHKGELRRDFDIANVLNDGTQTAYSNNRMTGNPSINIKSVKADLDLPIGETKFSLGGKISDVRNIADNTYETLIGISYVTDASKTNAFSYREQIQALYANAHRSVKKFETQIGLRVEHTNTNGYSATLGQRTIRDYTQLFPSCYIQYSLNENNTFNINYARRINRPGYSFLNPFRFFYTSNSYSEGNPYLSPSYRNGVEIGYSYKSQLFIKVFASQTDNYWDRIIENDTLTGSTRSTRDNLGTARETGLNMNVVLNPSKWWECRLGATGIYNNFQLNHFNKATTLSSLFGWAETNNTFFLNKKKTLSAELYGYYYTPRQKDYKLWASMSCINFGIRGQFFQKQLIVAILADDIMAKTYWFQTNKVNGTTEYSYDDERSIRITVTYKFGNKNVKGKRERTTTTEEIQRANQ